MLESTKMSDNPKYKAMTRQDLQDAYNVNYWTLYNWLKKIPNLNIRYVRVFSPKQVQAIVEHLGEP